MVLAFAVKYDPAYELDELVSLFNDLHVAGKLPAETKEFLHKAWQEIEKSDCYKGYGLPNKRLDL